MNKNDVLFYFHSPHSSWSLRYRASKLPECDYQKFLLVLADVLDAKRLSTGEARKVIEYWREGNPKLAASVFKGLSER